MTNIKVTESAKSQLDLIKGENRYLRILLVKSGCCSYAFEFYEDERRAGDELLEADGYQFLITDREKEMLGVLKAIDYGRHGLFKTFKAVLG